MYSPSYLVWTVQIFHSCNTVIVLMSWDGGVWPSLPMVGMCKIQSVKHWPRAQVDEQNYSFISYWNLYIQPVWIFSISPSQHFNFISITIVIKTTLSTQYYFCKRFFLSVGIDPHFHYVVRITEDGI